MPVGENAPCPHCGYCPHCGRSNQPVIRWYPAYPPYMYPNYPNYTSTTLTYGTSAGVAN